MFTQKSGILISGLFFLLMAFPSQSQACDRTFLNLDSIVPAGGNFQVYLTLCIGGGITGTQKGADADTRTFAFNFYGSPTLGDQGFSPASVVGQETGIPLPGTFVGSFLGSSYSIAYIDPGSMLPFICVSSTANCGNEHSQCDQYVFTMNELFDSVRVVGAEGSGNPLAGCFPDNDMLIDLTSSLDVEWTYFDANSEGSNVDLSWGISEFDAGKYEILRGTDDQSMVLAGSFVAEEFALDYQYRDSDLETGNYFYRLIHTSLNGDISQSEVVSARIMADHSGLTIAPSVIQDRAQLRYYAEENEAHILKIYQPNGQEVFRKQLDSSNGLNEMEIDFGGFGSGVYLVELRGGNSVEVQRIVHL